MTDRGRYTPASGLEIDENNDKFDVTDWRKSVNNFLSSMTSQGANVVQWRDSIIDFLLSMTNQELDVSGRRKVASPETLLEEKNVSVAPTIGNFTSGGATITRQAQRSSFLLDTNGVDGARAYRQSRQRAIYQPGKVQEVQITAVLGGTSSNVIKRMGYFDDNNGLFFQWNGDDIHFVIRSDTSGAPVDTLITRDQWQDKLDGTGESGITLDLDKAQIFQLDFLWLSFGDIRFGFVIDGVWQIAYTNTWANLGDVAYMRNPNLPLRWEIEQNGAGAGSTFEAVCGVVASLGGFDKRGLSLAFESGEQEAEDGDETEILAVRLNSTGVEVAVAFLERVKVLCVSNSNYIYRVYLNDNGMSGGTWTGAPGSLLEQSTDRTGTPGGPNAVKIDVGYGTTSNDESLGDVVNLVGLGFDAFTQQADVVSITVQRQSGSQDEDYEAAMIIRQEA